MAEKDLSTSGDQRVWQPPTTASPLFNAGYDTSVPQGNAAIAQQGAFGSSIVANNDASILLGRPAIPATPAQPGDVTAALGSLSPTQAAMLLSVLPKADMQRFWSALPGQDQQQLSTMLNGQNITDQQFTNAIGSLPQADVVGAFSQIPTTDLRSGLQGLSLSRPATTAQPGDIAPGLGNISPKEAGVLLENLPQADLQKFWSALPAKDQQQLSTMLSGNYSKQQLINAIGSLPPADVSSALNQALPVFDLNALQQSPAKAGQDGQHTDTTTGGNTPADNKTDDDGWVKWGAAALLVGGGAVAWNKYKNNPVTINQREARLKAKGLAGDAGAGVKAAEVPKDVIETFDTPKIMTEGPFAGGSLTNLRTTPEGVAIGKNAEGIFGPETATEMHIFPKPIQLPNGPFRGGTVTRLSTIPGVETTAENPAGVFNDLQGSSGTTITKYGLRPNAYVSENLAGLEGPGTRTMAVEFREPLALDSGPFAGMKLTHFSTVPEGAATDGFKVTAMNRAGLLGEGTDTIKVANLSFDEFQALLKGTTGTAEMLAAKAAAAGGGGVVAAAGETVAEKVVAAVVDTAKVATKL